MGYDYDRQLLDSFMTQSPRCFNSFPDISEEDFAGSVRLNLPSFYLNSLPRLHLSSLPSFISPLLYSNSIQPSDLSDQMGIKENFRSWKSEIETLAYVGMLLPHSSSGPASTMSPRCFFCVEFKFSTCHCVKFPLGAPVSSQIS